MGAKRKLSVINVGPTPPRIGGSPFVNIETMTALAERGHHVRCIPQLSSEQLAHPDYDHSWKDTTVEVYPVEAEFIPSSIPLTKKQFKDRSDMIKDRFYQLVTDERPDVVMIGHESQSYFVNKAARDMGIPVVQVLHGTPTHMIDSEEYPVSSRERFLDAIGEATLVVGVSQYLANIVRAHGITQATHIYNATNTRAFRPLEKKDPGFLKDLGLELTDRIVMHASTLRQVKRPLDIVESAKFVIEEDPDVRYVIVGDGPLRSVMEDRAKELGIREYFVFTGKVPFASIPEYFQHADVFLLPSEQEGFGRVIREAQACETVPVASNVGPMEEVISDRVTGSLFPKGRINDLATKVLELTQDISERSRIGKNAREAATSYDIENMANDYEFALSDPLNFLTLRLA